MLLSRNKKIMYTPVNPQFYYIKVGFKESKLYRYVFVMRNRIYRGVSIGTKSSHTHIVHIIYKTNKSQTERKRKQSGQQLKMTTMPASDNENIAQENKAESKDGSCRTGDHNARNQTDNLLDFY